MSRHIPGDHALCILFAPAALLALGVAQQQQLEVLVRAGTTPQWLVRRRDVILLASQRAANRALAQQAGLSQPTSLAA